LNSPGPLLRALIDAPEILVMPGVYDGFSMRQVQSRDFKAAFVTGAGVSESVLGQPDVGLMGLEDNLGAVRRIAACSTLPLIADGDTGYGNAVNVFHMVRAFQQAGVGGVMIEDQQWPKRCGHMSGKLVIPAEEMVQKLRAAAAARRDPSFVIMARTDAYAAHGIGEAVRRLNLYAQAGADLLFADAVLREQDIGAAVAGVSGPLCVNMGFGIRSRPTTPLISARRLQELGVSVVIYPRLLTACALQGMSNGLDALEAALRSGTVEERPDLAVSFDQLNALMGHGAVADLEKRFLTPEQLDAKYG
jgi:2-methylisocitrate lyase-like PEP mutase family enzyme